MRSSRRRKRWPLRLKTASSETILHSSGPMLLPPTCLCVGRDSLQEVAGTPAFSGPVLRGSELAGDVAITAVDRTSRMISRAMAIPRFSASELALLSTHMGAETGRHASVHHRANLSFVPSSAVTCAIESPMEALSRMCKLGKIADAGWHSSVPVGRSLHLPAEIEQCKVAAGLPDDLQCNRHCAVIKTNWQGDSGESQHVDEARPAAEGIKRRGRKPLGYRIAFVRRGRTNCHHGQHGRIRIVQNLRDEIGGKGPSRLSARSERLVLDFQSLGDASPEALIAGEAAETCMVETRGLTLHDDQRMLVDRVDGASTGDARECDVAGGERCRSSAECVAAARLAV